jgi:MFS family permease
MHSYEEHGLLNEYLSVHATWRWCFYMNLPIGGVSMVSLALCLKLPAPKDASLPLKAKLLKLDPLGTMAFVPCIVCLILALQWGGTTYSWKDGRVIALLVIFSILLVVFVCIQFWKGGNGTVPPRIIGQRSISFGLFYSICSSGSMMIFIYVSCSGRRILGRAKFD